MSDKDNIRSFFAIDETIVVHPVPSKGDKQGKACHLGDRSYERRGRSWGAFIGVRRPQMERHCRDLEAETGDDQYPCNIKERARPRCGNDTLNLQQIRAAAQSIEITEAEEQECRRHTAE